VTVEQEKLYQNIFGSIYWKDLEGVYQGANLHAAKMVGLSRSSDLIGKTDYDLFSKEIADKFTENDRNVIEKNTSIVFEESVVSAEGKHLIQLSCKRPLVDSHDEIIGVIGNTIDITYIKEKENQLIQAKVEAEEAKRYINSIINNIPGAIYWKDVNGHYIGCNKFVAEAAGFSSPQDMIGKTDYDLVWKEFAEEWIELDKHVMALDKTIVKEEKAKLADGSIITELTYKTPLKNINNEIIGIIGTSLDITEKKKLEEALNLEKEEAIKAKSQAETAKQNEEELRKAAMIFAGSVAHDLTTPLTNINLMANNVSNMLPELLKIYQTIETNKQNLNEKQLAYLEKFPQSLQAQLTELNEYIKDSLKALNKTVAGIKTQDDLVKCELWRCMQKVIDEYPYLENEKNLIHWDTEYLFNFMGNPLLFYRIMFNLIKNSLYQIREKSRGEIHIRTEQAETHNVLYFKDTAGSVTQETVDNIFNGYQTTKAEGTGVGLAFCKLTMQSFGGEMDCRLVDGDCIEFSLKFKCLL